MSMRSSRAVGVCAVAGACSLLLALLVPLSRSQHPVAAAAPHASPEAIAVAQKAVELEMLRPVRRTAGESASAGTWELRSPPQKLSSLFNADGWELSPLAASIERGSDPKTPDAAHEKWRWRYQLSKVGRGDAAADVGAPKVSGSSERVSLERPGGITEWYKSSRAGIEQGFAINDRPLPRASGSLELRGALLTDLSLLSSSDSHVEFGRSGEALVRYAELAVFDADGKKLSSRMAFSPSDGGGSLTLVIDDSQARYPLTVDPVTSSPLWTKAGAASTNQFGYSVASAGDVNGDGFADVIVGAPQFSAGDPNEGAAYLFYGSASGPSTSPSQVIEGNESGARMGWSVASAGDVNNDGFSDVVIGIPYADCGPFTDVGKAVVYAGSASGLTLLSSTNNCSPTGALLGWSVAGAGDVNKDGFSDIVMGCPGCLSGIETDGKAFLFLGSASGISGGADWSYPPNDDIVPGGAANFGLSVSGAGDVNNDGFADILVGAPNWDGAAQAFVFFGSASGPASAPDWSYGFVVSSNISLASGGDTNGDGFDDVLLGAKDLNLAGQEGMADLFLGSASGPSTLPDWTERGSGHATASFGASVASARDINGDGFDDVLVGSPGYDPGGGAVGKALLFLGSASGLETTEAWYASGSDLGGSALGGSVASAGDVNGDGFPDVIIGDPYRTSPILNQGSAFTWSNFNIARVTPTPISISPGGGGLPAPQVTTSGRSATITAPKVTVQLTNRARNAATKKLMQRGLTRAQATKALSKLAITYVFTVTQAGRAADAAIESDDLNIAASSITRRSKRNQVTINNLPPGTRVASYRIEIATRKPPVVLGSTKPSGKTRFTITR